MKYFFDTEFLEGKQNKTFFGIKYGSTKPTIDLISIGIVSEDGREYYAISKDFNLEEAWNRYDLKKTGKTDLPGINRSIEKVYWIRENVLFPIYNDIVDFGNRKKDEYFTFENFKSIINKYGKTNNQIAEEILDFVNPGLLFHVSSYNNSELKEGGRLHEHFEKHNVDSDGHIYFAKPTFYGYYSAYDHVALCWLFGKMIDLPQGFPMYTIDLQQEADRIYNLRKEEYTKSGGKNFITKLFNHLYYPRQNNEHSAIHDARWNKYLYDFLSTIK